MQVVLFVTVNSHQLPLSFDRAAKVDKSYKSLYFVSTSFHSHVSGKNDRTFVTSAKFAGLLLVDSRRSKRAPGRLSLDF
jgi:hypothetical protein